jgi:penicillin-binding protein 1A
VHTTLQPFATTALGASELSLIELATAYRTIATGVLVEPYVIRQVERGGDVIAGLSHAGANVAIDRHVLALIQEGLRGVVRIPTGTAHALDSRSFPIAVMGKTGTTNDFRDALFVGSTFGRGGITVAVRIGYDDNRTLGARETGGRVALPVFREVMLNAYRDGIVGATPVFPVLIEEHITHYLQGDQAAPVSARTVAAAPPIR